MALGRLVRYRPIMGRPRVPNPKLSRREQLLALAGAIPGAWLAAGSEAQAAPPEAGAASSSGVRLPLAGAVSRPLADYLQDRPISVRDFGAIGDFDPTTGQGNDDTAAIQAALNAMSTRDAAPSTLIFPGGYYKITAPLHFPFGFVSNTIDLCGAHIYYRGAPDRAAAIFRITRTQFINNTIRNGKLHCQDRCGFGLYVVGETDGCTISANIVDTLDIYHPAVRAIQFGDFSDTGFDMDGACWTFRNLRTHLKDNQGGILIDAPNIFNTAFISNYWGGWDRSAPLPYLRVKRGSGTYIFDLFTGDNAEGAYAIELNEGNTTILGWNTEGTAILKMEGFVGERRNVYVANLMVNDSTRSAVPTPAILAPDGELILESATLGKANIHPRDVHSGDRLSAINVYLGSNEDGSVFGRYLLDHPDRCVIEGRALLDVASINGNTQFDLWRGDRPDDPPWGYEKSPVGTCTIMRDAAPDRLLNGPFTARLTIARGGLAGGMCDGLLANVPICHVRTAPQSLVAVVRGKAEGLRGAAVVARMRFLDGQGNVVNEAVEGRAAPGPDGRFILFARGKPLDARAVTAQIGVGLGVAGASGILNLQTFHLLRYDPYTVNGGENWRAIVDAWTKYPAQTNPIEDYAKCGVTALHRGGALVRQWLGNAPPTSGSHVRGDTVWNASPAAGDPAGWMCVSDGTPGGWAAMMDLRP